MKHRIIFLVIAVLAVNAVSAQQGDSTSPEAKAKVFLRQGDYTNAIMLLNRAVTSKPNDLDIQKDLAYAYYLKRDFVKGLEIAKPIVQRKDADVQSYQILGMMYKAIEGKKDLERMYKDALKRFPNSASLLNEYGEVLWTKKNFADAVKQWEKGILSDPSYPGNYYNAAKFYYFSADKVWGILYGEIFVNLESYTGRTAEIQTQLVDGYKKLFTDQDIMKNQQKNSDFATAVLENMQRNASQVSGGISIESLNKLRKAFITDWFQKDAPRFPYRLFEYQQQLIKAGMFDAYNQWVFSGSNANQYKQWTTAHTDEASAFANFQKNRVFKLPKGQYYKNLSQ